MNECKEKSSEPESLFKELRKEVKVMKCSYLSWDRLYRMVRSIVNGLAGKETGVFIHSDGDGWGIAFSDKDDIASVQAVVEEIGCKLGSAYDFECRELHNDASLQLMNRVLPFHAMDSLTYPEGVYFIPYERFETCA